MKYKEFELQKQVSKYLKTYYPFAKFDADYASHISLTIPQKVRNKSIQCDDYKRPDTKIFVRNKNFTGLALEIKKETPFKKDGTLKKQIKRDYEYVGGKKILIKEVDHLQEQQKAIDYLISQGWHAQFVWEFSQAKKVIDDYMSNI